MGIRADLLADCDCCGQCGARLEEAQCFDRVCGDLTQDHPEWPGESVSWLVAECARCGFGNWILWEVGR